MTDSNTSDSATFDSATDGEASAAPQVSITVERPLASGSENDSRAPVKEINGPRGLEPTRYGDWESKGRCHDF